MKTPAGKIISPNGNLYNLFDTKSHKKEAIFSDVPHKENTLLTELSSFSKDANMSDELLLSSRFHVEINNLQSSRFHVEINNLQSSRFHVEINNLQSSRFHVEINNRAVL